MDTSSQTSEKQKPKKNILLLFVVIALFISVTFITALIFLPKIVSTAEFKEYLERHSTKVLTRGLRIGTLSWSWHDGIVIKNIFVEDDPSFSEQPVILIENAFIRPGFRELIDRRLALDVVIDGIHFNYIRDGNGKSNLETLLLPSKKVLEEEERPTKKSPSEKRPGDGHISFPLDIMAKIHLDGIVLSADDQMSQRKLDLDNGSVHLDIPSFYQHPVTLNVNAAARIDRNDPIPIHISLSMENKGKRPKELRPENLSMDISGVLPGIEFNAKGDLGERGVTSKVGLLPGVILEIVKPFLPEDLKDSAVDGRLEFNLAAKIDSKKRINFNTGIHAVKVSTSGKFVKNKHVGPVDVVVKNTGVVDLPNSILEITDGSVHFLNEGIVEWNATVSKFSSGKPKVNATIPLVYLNLEEIHNLSAVFLPSDFPLKFHNTPRKGAPSVTLKEVVFSGGPGADDNRLGIKSLAINLPGIEFRQKENVVSIHDMSFVIEDMETEFKNIFPLNARMRTSLTAGRVNIPGRLKIDGLTKVLDAEYRMQTGEHMELLLKELAVHTPSILLVDKTIGQVDTDAGITLKPCRLVFHKGRLDIEDGGINFTIGEFVNAQMNYTIQDTAETKLQTSGDIHVNLKEIPETLLGDYKGKIDLSGDAVLNWQFNGRLPNGNEKKLLASISGINSGEALSFIENAGIRLSVDRMKTHINLGDKNMIAAGDVTASPLISYEYNHKENAGEILGHITIKDIKMQQASGMDTSADLHVNIKGRHDGLHRIRFNETALIEPFSIEQSININLFGAEKVLEKRREKHLQDWLAKAGGDIQALLRIKNMSETGQLKRDVDIDGDMAAGIMLGLLPGKMANARIWINASDVDFEMDGIAGINDFNGRVNIKKTYQIVSLKEKETDNPGLELKPLSSVVMENAFGILPTTTDPVANSRWTYAHDKNRFHPERTIGFSSMHIDMGPVPVRMDRFKADINLENGLPAIEYFQNDILDGTVNGSIKTETAGGTYFLNADIHFTGIDFNTILPAEKNRTDTEDTEVSGHLKLNLPITDDMDTFLGKIENHLIFTHIGSHALERLLYSLDPYESNEAIVTQRRLLQKGSPKWVELKVADGSLSMGGEISIEGVDINFPRLERLNITNLPGIEKYAGRLAGLKPVVGMLDIASASAIKLGKSQLKAGNLE